MDLIDRAKVERITFQEPSYSDPINVLTEVRDKVRALPTVEAEPVKHAYLRKSRVFGGLDECSNCGCAYPHNREKGVYLNYCSKCGAKFEGEVWD